MRYASTNEAGTIMIPWQDISYLKSGTASQQRAYRCLSDLTIFEALAPFSPILVSTVCLDIDIESSDLDIICFAPDSDLFSATATTLYGALNGFSIRKSSRGDALVVGFCFHGCEIEIYAQNTPVTEQRAYRHLCQTARILKYGGTPMREAIRALKMQGVKTEPAIASCLGLPNDPYAAVEGLERVSDQDLEHLVTNALRTLEKIDS